MKDLRLKIKRQSEILGLVLDQRTSITTSELASLYNCEELTIKRDLQSLRSLGIDIHSRGKNGIQINNKPRNKELIEIVSNYLRITTSRNLFEKTTVMLVNKLGLNTLPILAKLQICIDKRRSIRIDYYKSEDKTKRKVEVDPYLIFESDNYWRLLAKDGQIIKQYLIDRIEDVEVTSKKYQPISKVMLNSLFDLSFKAWIGEGDFEVVLKIDEPWTSRLKARRLMINQVIIDKGNGTIIFKTHVNSLHEIAAWIVARGKGIIVLEPVDLKNQVIQIAREALSNY
ncbi:MAG: transcriptional regulator [Melioribacteraceae bacterium]